ncbi:6-bladed beta-propeller [bacterium]|nr:6-bladed beta-propeller [bacterium]
MIILKYVKMCKVAIGFCIFIFILCCMIFCQKGTRGMSGQFVRNVPFAPEGSRQDQFGIINLKLSKILEIGLRDTCLSSMLFSISDIEVDEEGYIYVVDGKAHCIKVFDSNGQHVRNIGKEGYGPGELYMPSYVALGGNELVYVYNIGGCAISSFDRNGNFLNDLNIGNKFILDIIANPENHLYITHCKFAFMGEKLDAYQHISQYNSRHELINRFGASLFLGIDDRGCWNNAKPVSAKYKDIGILFGYSYPYQLKMLSWEGELKWTVKCQFNPSVPPQKRENYSGFIDQVCITRILSLPDSRILVSWKNYGSQWFEEVTKYFDAKRNGNICEPNTDGIRNYYDLFSADGLFLQRFEVASEIGDIVFIDNNSFCYTKSLSADGIPVIYKYKMEFIENTNKD